MHREPLVNHYIPYETWQSMSDARDWFDYVQERRTKRIAQHFVIELKTTKEVIASCLSVNFDPTLHNAEFGYVMNKKAWGYGYMFEAMHCFTQALQQVLSLRKLTAHASPDNVPSIKLLKKLGFTQQSIVKEDGETLYKFMKALS